MIFEKTATIRNGNKKAGELIITIPHDFPKKEDPTGKISRVYMFMNRKDELLVSYDDIRGNGLYRQTKRPVKVRRSGQSSYIITLPLSFTERNHVSVSDELQIELKKSVLYVRPFVDGKKKKD